MHIGFLSCRTKLGKMNAGELIKKKLTKVTLGASAATTVLEEYADSTQGKKRRRAGNERLLKDKAYLKTISKYVLNYNFVHSQTPGFASYLQS